MDKTAQALLEHGDIAGLLARNKTLYGDLVMTMPQVDPTGQTVILPPAPPAPVVPQVVTIDEAEINRRIETARQQEKDKLYPELQQLREQQAQTQQTLAQWQAEREQKEQEAEAARQAAAQAAEEKRQAELGFSEKLTEFQQTQEQRMAELQNQLAQRDAILERERQYTELVQYIGQAMQNDSDPNGPGRGQGPTILPELRDLVTGNTVEEVEQSISALAQRSASILQQVASVQQDARTSSRGVGVTAPPVGPLDNNSGHQTVTADDVRNMDMSEYAKNRGRLLGAASQQQQGRGMFG